MMKLKWLACVDYGENVILIFFCINKAEAVFQKKMRIKIS